MIRSSSMRLVLIIIFSLPLFAMTGTIAKKTKGASNETEFITCKIQTPEKEEPKIRKVKIFLSENGPRYSGSLRMDFGEIRITDDFSEKLRVVELFFKNGKQQVSGNPITLEEKNVVVECHR